MKTASEAIDTAKGFYGREGLEGEPLVTTDCVILREITHALEILWGYSETELNYGDDDAVASQIAHALSNGELVARVFRAGENPEISPIIPRLSWPSFESAAKDESNRRAVDSGFWIGRIHSEQDCVGFVGALPFVLRSQAEQWLDAHAQHPDKCEHGTPESRDKAFREWVGSHPKASPPTTKDCDEWGKRNTVNGIGTSRDTIRELRRALPSESRRRRGAPKK